MPGFTPFVRVNQTVAQSFYGQQIDLAHLTTKVVTIQGQPFTFGTF